MIRASCLFFVLMTSLAHAAWTPPPNPNPQDILTEAQADARAGHFEDALAKHVWFFENALKLQPSQTGVRLSFALSDWVVLGKTYPPALEKLRSVRDDAARRIREGTQVREDFKDFESINKYLSEENQTRDLFIWLDSHKPEVAKDVYPLAQRALIKASDFRLCGRYLEPDASFQNSVRGYKRNLEMSRDPSFGERMKSFGEKSFSQTVTTLVALLVINERRAQAEGIVEQAVKEWNDPKFKEQLDKALEGKVPDPWP
jgi:hypothetical protein